MNLRNGYILTFTDRLVINAYRDRRIHGQSSIIRRTTGLALGVGEVKFTGQVLPTAKKVQYQIDIKRVIARGLVMGIADATMSIDGREIYVAKNLRVGLFTSTEDF